MTRINAIAQNYNIRILGLSNNFWFNIRFEFTFDIIDRILTFRAFWFFNTRVALQS
jgi:hypothetical protein